MAISLDKPVPLTKLEAVNIVLRSRGQGPTASLGDAARPVAQEATETLAQASLEVQSGEWNFNKELELELEPDASSEIVIPANLLRFNVVKQSKGMMVTQRGGRLYDMEDSTYKFDRSVYVEATVGLAFEDLPQPARWYIALLASLNFANQEVPGDASMRPSAEQLARAKRDLEIFDSKLVSNNLRTNPHFYRMRRRR